MHPTEHLWMDWPLDDLPGSLASNGEPR
jgi:hypothetical protein